MGGPSRERRPAAASGKPWSAVGWRSGDGPPAHEAATVFGAEAWSARCGEDHEEAKAQEGQVGHWNANRELVTQTDSHVDKGPEDEEWLWTVDPRERPGRPEAPQTRTGKASRWEERQEGMPAVTSCRACVAGRNP